MKKFGKRLELHRFDFSPSQEQKIRLSLSNLRKKRSKNEKKGAVTPVTPSLAPFAKYGNKEFEQEQIETRYIKQRSERYNKKHQSAEAHFAKRNCLKKDFTFNPEHYGIDPETFWVMQRNMQNTPEPMLVAQNLSMKPQMYEEMSLSPYPQVERCSGPETKFLLTNHNIATGNVPSEQSEHIEKDTKNMKMPHYFRPIPQPSLVAQNVGLNLQKYKDNIMPIPENLGSQSFGLRQHNYDEMPISFIQTETRSGTPREMLYARADLGKRQAPYEDIERLNQHTAQPILMTPILYQQRHGTDELAMSYPQTATDQNRRLDHPRLFLQSEAFIENEFDPSQDIDSDPEDIATGTDEMQIYSNDMSKMQENNEQPSFVNPTLEMVKQRFENISPPTDSQSEMCINSRNKVPPTEASVNFPFTPPGYISEGPLPIGMIRQNYEQTRYAQNFEMDRQRYELLAQPSTRRNEQYFPSQNMGMGTDNIGIKQQNIREKPQPKFVDTKFETDRRRHEHLTRPILFPQTEIRTQPTTRVLHPEAGAATGNHQYVPFENIEKIKDVRKMHQNTTQSQETFTQTFEMDQQRCEGMAQSSPYAQLPTNFAPTMYNARAMQPSGYCCGQPQFDVYKNPGMPLQPHQPQQTHSNIANTHHYAQQHPNYAPQYRQYNQFYNQHDFNYDAACFNKQEQQQQQQQKQRRQRRQQHQQQQQPQQQQQQQQEQQQQKQQKQQPRRQHQQQQQPQQQKQQQQQQQQLPQQQQLQQIAAQQSYNILNQYHAQNNANSTRQPNIMTQQQHQQLLHRKEMHQQSYECCQYYEHQNNTKR